jgi:two-component system cell cycle sensor histidine kinase/response regulator CckA
VASDALQAVMILRQDPEVDLLVTDLSMPGADGIVLIRQARAIKPAMPAILLTGNPEEAQSHAQAASGSFQVLGKPVESERLTRQIDLLLSGDVHPADNIALK